jgi:signal peptidase II
VLGMTKGKFQEPNLKNQTNIKKSKKTNVESAELSFLESDSCLVLGILFLVLLFVIRHSSFGFRHLTKMKFIVFLSLPLYALDQCTKQLVLRFISPWDARTVVPDFFTLVNVTNTGAAFGSFKGNNTFFVVISIIALVVVTVLLLRHGRPDAWRDVSLALLLAGILGNLTDRLLHGHVIDFLLFNLHVRYANPWPAFNVADSCISIAVVLFIIHSLTNKEHAAEQEHR